MPVSEPPRSNLGLFGGPGIILILLALIGIALAAAYVATGGRLSRSGGVSLSLPGALGPAPGATGQPQVQTPTAAPAGVERAGDPSFLQPMQPMAAAGAGSSAAPPPAPRYPVITEDLSPLDLLVRHTPDPELALTELAGTDARRFRRPGTAPIGARRLALVATGLGIDRAMTAQAILALPPEVSLSFDPASAELEDWIAAARAYGHEALIDLELGTTESLAAAPVDAGESRLLAELGPQENLRRLDATLARAPKAAGVAISITDAFLGDAAALTPILERLQAGGWIAVGLPVTAPLTVAADRVFTDQVAANALARDAMALRTLARQRGAALAIGPAEVAIGLAEDLARVGAGASEIVLVPASALVEN